MAPEVVGGLLVVAAADAHEEACGEYRFPTNAADAKRGGESVNKRR